MKMKTALPKAWWWVVWGTRARVASMVGLQEVCLVCVPSVTQMEVFWND